VTKFILIRCSCVLEVRRCLEQARSFIPTFDCLDKQFRRLLEDPVLVASQLMQTLRHIILWAVFIATVGLALLAGLLLMCAQFWWLIKGTISISMWCFFAGNTTNILLNDQEDKYVGRLSFWVMAPLWSALQVLPVVGFWLSLAMPWVVFTTFVAGETVLTCAELVVTQVVAKVMHVLGYAVPLVRKLRNA